jgi:cell division protein FtsZ
MMGTGEAQGDDRAVQAAEKAIANPLLDEISLNGAKGVLINITGGHDLTLFELDEAANIIREKVDPEANIIVGSTLDTTMEGRIRVSVVATGIDASVGKLEVPLARRSMAAPLTLTPTNHGDASRMQSQRVSPSIADPMPELDEELESGLFDAAASQADIEAEADDFIDDLPLPAYRPEPAAAQPSLVRSAPAAIEADAGDFVAPRPRQAGQPSPEALARLQAAVSRPSSGAAKFQRPTPVSAPTPAPAPAAQPGMAAKPRFGIGSLINRMAGHLEATGPGSAPAGRAQPPVTAYDDEHEIDNDQDRIEIPAFLRRQAN